MHDVAAFRLAINDLNPLANADDAQIATSIRCRGWRALMDPMAQFSDVAPHTLEGQRGKRFAEHKDSNVFLIRQRKQATAKSQGVFGRIFRRQFHFHIVAPLALTIASATAVLRWGFIALYGWPATFTLANSLHLGFSLLRSHMRGALVAQSTRQVKRATLIGRPMVEQHGMVGSLAHNNSKRPFVASMGTAHRCARAHHGVED